MRSPRDCSVFQRKSAVYRGIPSITPSSRELISTHHFCEAKTFIPPVLENSVHESTRPSEHFNHKRPGVRETPFSAPVPCRKTRFGDPFETIRQWYNFRYLDTRPLYLSSRRPGTVTYGKRGFRSRWTPADPSHGIALQAPKACQLCPR